jgi:hypothetical protein
LAEQDAIDAGGEPHQRLPPRLENEAMTMG